MRVKERVCSAVWSHGVNGGLRDVQDCGSSSVVVVGSDDGDDGDGNVGVEVVVVERARFLVFFFLDGMVDFCGGGGGGGGGEVDGWIMD